MAADTVLQARQQSDTSDFNPDTGNESTDAFLRLIASPFDSQFMQTGFVASLVFSVVFTVLLVVLFSLARPYHNVVYAPRAKYADSKHAPPTVPKGMFGWVRPLAQTKEADLVAKCGLDAAIFMRVVRMMRNIFSILTVLGLGILVPTTLLASNLPTSSATFFTRLTPQYMYGVQAFWVYVALAYIIDAVICFFLFINYKAVLKLRRAYFESDEYRRGLHSRTLLITDLPKDSRSDEGIVRVVDKVGATHEVPRASIGRNVKDLPELIEEHEKTVRELESHLAKYLKNPNALPAKRPTCKVRDNDRAYTKGQKVDAIEYLTSRIKQLEIEIKDVRQSVDKRNALPYGFASYEEITSAHNVAYAARKSGPEGTVIRQAPQPHDLIWRNLKMSKGDRRSQRIIGNLWVTLLTVVWIGPNVMIAVFLSNLSHLGQVWPAFARNLQAHPTGWGIVQGIAAPALTTLFYFYLPKVFRKIVQRAGDTTRTGRERHVTHKLFSFFLFNNLVVFSFFSAAWGFIAATISIAGDTGNAWQAIIDAQPLQKIVRALITVSPYWTYWLLQRNLGAAVDLSQLITLLWGSMMRRWFSPTPRERIELSAPQPFDYAIYYNYFLFYAAVTLCFGVVQPLTFAITALYFWLDSFSKKYLLLYIFITKYESGGMFWRTLFNRMLIATILGNVVVALVVAAGANVTWNWAMLAALAPLIPILAGFKIYCARVFDGPLHFYSQGKKQDALLDEERAAGKSAGHKRRSRGGQITSRMGNPALYKPLITPMVSAKSQHLLKQVYAGRISFDEDSVGVNDYTDVYMTHMDARKPGKGDSDAALAPFEFVNESEMDYSHWKNDPNFRDQHGGDGQLYGTAADVSRPGTPGSYLTSDRDSWYGGDSSDPSRPGTGFHDSTNPSSRAASPTLNDVDMHDFASGAGGVEYPQGYHVPSPAVGGSRPSSPGPGFAGARRKPLAARGNTASTDRINLVSHAAIPGRSDSPSRGQEPYQQTHHRPYSSASGHGGDPYGHLRYGSAQYDQGDMGDMGTFTPGRETPGYGSNGWGSPGEETSYDYFRRPRAGGT